ncbi:MAG: NAD(P)-binding domain-containing protein [Rhodobacter sp.]|nr:NAD(P)-binding domain-containing protein [Rhodobacter sp.]
MKLGFIGTGIIATAVVHGIAMDGHEITVSQRNAGNAALLAKAYPNVRVGENQAVVERSDIVFLGLTDQAAPAVLDQLAFRPDQRVISFMAGTSRDVVADMVAPANAAALMLPFPRIAEGGSPILALGDVDLVEQLFGRRNTVFALATGGEMHACLCAQAVLSPIARMLDDAAAWLGPRLSDPTQGEAFLRALISSSLGGGLTAAALIEALNTPDGYNQRLRLKMEASGMGVALAQGLDELSASD